jgi:hypothetical protein
MANHQADQVEMDNYLKNLIHDYTSGSENESS